MSLIVRAVRENSLRSRDRVRWLPELIRAIVNFRIGARSTAQFARSIEKFMRRRKKFFIDAGICKEMP